MIASNQTIYMQFLESLDESLPGFPQTTGYSLHIRHIAGKIEEFRSCKPDLPTKEQEIEYFSKTWPQVYSRLFYYILLQRFWLHRKSLPPGALNRLIRLEQDRIGRFFSRHREFWTYYKTTPEVIATLFTRSHSRDCIFDPLSYIMDHESATIAGYRVAWALAYEEYNGWLQQAGHDNPSADRSHFTWNETKSAAVEIIKSLAEAGSISIDGKPATAAQLRADFEERYNIRLDDFDSMLYQADTRKIDEIPYLTKLGNAFLGRKRRLRK
jgi:hypothetical protein